MYDSGNWTWTSDAGELIMALIEYTSLGDPKEPCSPRDRACSPRRSATSPAQARRVSADERRNFEQYVRRGASCS